MLFWTGSALVENGSPIVTVAAGPALTSEVAARYSMAVIDGAVYFVDGLIDTGSLGLTRPYDGADGTVPFEIWPVSPEVSDLVRLAQVLARTQAQINVLDRNSQGLFFNHIGVTGDADPGPGNLAFNHADPAQATQLYVDYLDANAAHRNVSQLLARFDVGTTIRLRSLASTAFYEFDVAGTAVDRNGFFRMLLTSVAHDGIIGSGEPIALSWSRSGEGLEVGGAGDLAGRAAYNDRPKDFIYMALVGGETVLYVKNSAAQADWSNAFPLTKVGAKGDPGDRGPFTTITFGPVTTLNPGQPASATLVQIDASTVRVDFGLPRGANGTGTGDVVGPAASTSGRIALFSGTTGKLLTQAGLSISDLEQARTLVTQAEAEAGTGTATRGWTPQRVAQAIAALAASPADVFRRSNILGTVSQVAGAPTGALIERGSNANGEYVRFADGMQICTGTGSVSTSAGPIMSGFGASQYWAQATPTLPSAFVNNSYFVVAEPTTRGQIDLAGFNPSTTAFSLQVVHVSNSTAVPYRWFAIGRWF